MTDKEKLKEALEAGLVATLTLQVVGHKEPDTVEKVKRATGLIQQALASLSIDEEIARLRAENERLRTAPNFTVDDVLSVKAALTKLGRATPESNDLSPGEVLSMFRRLANQVRAGLYEWMPDQREQEEPK